MGDSYTGPVFRVSAYDGILSWLCANELAGLADNGSGLSDPLLALEKWV